MCVYSVGSSFLPASQLVHPSIAHCNSLCTLDDIFSMCAFVLFIFMYTYILLIHLVTYSSASQIFTYLTWNRNRETKNVGSSRPTVYFHFSFSRLFFFTEFVCFSIKNAHYPNLIISSIRPCRCSLYNGRTDNTPIDRIRAREYRRSENRRNNRKRGDVSIE